MRTYTVRRVESAVDVPLTGDADDAVWRRAEAAELDQFPWGDGPGPTTTVRALSDDEALYLRFHAEDGEITADVTDLNGPTFEDSSVEFFASPERRADGAPTSYFNFEANCCGTFKLAWQEPGWRERGIGRTLVSPADAAAVDVETSVPGPTKTADPDDESWWLAARIPLSTLCSLTGLPLTLDSGTVWRGNFYRSGVPDEAKGTWNRIDLPDPAYHSPEYFGRIEFE